MAHTHRPMGQPTPPALSLQTLLMMVLAIRVAAHFALPQPLQSDGLAYFTIAQHLSQGDWPVDNLGQHAFYSIGYPLVLAPFFALFGASPAIAFAVNLGLALLGGALVAAVAHEFSPVAARSKVKNLALLGYALWLPGVWNTTMLARENLSTPLLLLVMWCALRLLRQPPSLWLAAGTGLAWGAALLAGTSALPLVIAPLLAIAIAARAKIGAMVLTLVAAAALIITPWLLATNTMLGQPTLSTNSGFNLYIGNNPEATGRFVSIANTPVGPQWHAMRDRLGEAGATSALGDSAKDWIMHNPAEFARLAMVKLTLFWAPNLPDANDFALSPAVTFVRVFEVAQYLLFLGLGAAGLCVAGISPSRKAVIAVAIAGFWGLHSLAYIIERYRDPIMPLMIVLAASTLVDIARSHFTAKEIPHAA